MVTTNASATPRRRDQRPPPRTTTTTARRAVIAGDDRRPAAPSRTYSEQVTRLFGTERQEDGDDDDTSSRTEFEDDHNNVSYDIDIHRVTPEANPTSSGSSYLLTTPTTTAASPIINRRGSAPTFSSSSASAATVSATEGGGAQQPHHRHSSSAAAAAAPNSPGRRPLPRNLLRPIVTTSTLPNNGGSIKSQEASSWKKVVGMVCAAIVVAASGVALGMYRHARGQLQRELAAAIEAHMALEAEMLELQKEADLHLKHRSNQLKLEENLQQLNMELDETERAIQAEREKLSQRQEELERLVRAEQTTTQNQPAASSSEMETGAADVYAPFDAATSPMVGMSVPQQQGTGDNDATSTAESLVGRLVHNLGVEQYGLRPLHVELHLEYHHRSPSTKRTSIHRRYVLAQLSLLQRPVTTFVFLQQVEHDLYDRVTLAIVKEDHGEEGGGEAMALLLKTELTDRQRRQRSAMGLAHVPVQEAGSSYRDPLVAAEDDNNNSTETSSSTAAAAKAKANSHQRHYHLALSDDGDLVVTSSVNHPGVFATVVHGDPVLDKLLVVPADDGNGPAAKEMQVELISIRLLSSIDDEDPSHSEDEDDGDDDNDQEEEEEEEEYDRHDEH